MVAVAALGTAFATPADAAPAEDYVVGRGVIEIPDPVFPGVIVPIDIALDAHSDPAGGAATGTVFFRLPDGSAVFSGPVTCLAVLGNTAVIGFEDAVTGGTLVDVVDSSATGSPDTIGLRVEGLSGCSLPGSVEYKPLVSGDFVVHDAAALTSKDQCKRGGWRGFTDDDGQPLGSQGECIASVKRATGT